jgi:triosephosphate isomerase
MPRKPFIAGNWKMHNTISQSVSLAEGIKKAVNKNKADIMVAPSFTSLNAVAKVLAGSGIIVAAQDCYFEEKGAFTSQVSPAQIKDAGATCVILGHSERRSLFGDSGEILNKKIKAALAQKLLIVFCVGETLCERESEKTESIIGNQIEEGLEGFSQEDLKDIVVAYEPVWAIGTGKTATADQAQEVHFFIRNLLARKFGNGFADGVRILYGGSVKTDNVDAIMARADVDGVLVGGQSLLAQQFVRIIDFERQAI